MSRRYSAILGALVLALGVPGFSREPAAVKEAEAKPAVVAPPEPVVNHSASDAQPGRGSSTAS